ncbi:MAG: type II toxin-antitoxin system RelE/ParE family toxin [Bacteroidota bacterium]|nr:type II toxin-antitoxin system RelE/ParE family toxin [Bacteroidota bacterium]
MSYRIAYQQRAIMEYEVAATWYKERIKQAAEKFETAVNEKINLLRENPKRYRKTYLEFREIQLNKYPFNVIYLIDDIKMLVIISSIYHHKRNPKKKYKKL